MAIRYDIQVDQGTTFISYPMQWVYSGTKIPVNLTGFIATAQIRDSAVSTEILSTINVIITNEVDGRFYFTMLVNILTDGKSFQDKTQLVYDIKFTSATGAIFRVLNGYCYISPEVSK